MGIAGGVSAPREELIVQSLPTFHISLEWPVNDIIGIFALSAILFSSLAYLLYPKALRRKNISHH